MLLKVLCTKPALCLPCRGKYKVDMPWACQRRLSGLKFQTVLYLVRDKRPYRNTYAVKLEQELFMPH